MSTAYAVTGVLDRRQRLDETRLFRRSLALAIAVHGAGVLAAWLAPRWSAETPKPLEYVAIQIVPAARLGVEKPPPPKPAAAKPEPPTAVEAKPPAQPVPAPPKPEAAKPKTPPEPATPQPDAKRPLPESRPETAAAQQPEVQGSARGSVSGLALGASVAGLDNPDFTYGYYVDQMLALIQRNWIRPMVGSGVEATISYRIGRDGRILESRIANSSGINSFDLAALRAVQASSPLPPLPRAFRDSWLGVHLIFR